MTTPDYDILETAVLCILLGFREQYDDDPDGLRSILRPLLTRLVTGRCLRGKTAVTGDGKPPTQTPLLLGERRWVPRLLRLGVRTNAVERRWNQAERWMMQHGVNLRRCPLFLILGADRGAEKALEHSIEVVHRQKAVMFPTDDDSCFFRILGCPQAAYVLLYNGDWGRQQSGDRNPRTALSLPSKDQPPLPPDRFDEFRSLRANELDLSDKIKAPLEPANQRSLFQHIKWRRAPFASMNGITRLFPWQFLDSGPEASFAAWELQTALSSLGVSCPVFLAITGIERDPGLYSLIKSLPPLELNRRFGSRFPWLREPTDQRLADALAGCVENLVGGIDRLFYEVCRELLSAENLELPVPRREQLLALQAEVHCTKKAGLLHLLERLAEPIRASGPWLRLGGCYLVCSTVGTEHDGTPPYFLPGVLHKMYKCRDLVSWTGLSLQNHARWESRTRWVNAALVFAALSAVLAWGLFWPV
jgi:hypothetical protein